MHSFPIQAVHGFSLGRSLSSLSPESVRKASWERPEVPASYLQLSSAGVVWFPVTGCRPGQLLFLTGCVSVPTAGLWTAAVS